MSEHGNHGHCPDCGGSDGHHFNDCIYDGVGSGRGYSSGGSDVWKWICVICMVVFAGLFQYADGMQAVGASMLRGLTDVKVPVIIAFVSLMFMAVAYM